MAETLYLKDGSMAVMVHPPAAHLRELIEDRLGRDCALLFDRLIHGQGQDVVNDYEGAYAELERAVDGYSALCFNAREELEAIVELASDPDQRMTKRELLKRVEAVYDELNNNL